MNLKLLNSEATVERLHAIVKGARKELILVSPYMKLNENDRFWQSLIAAIKNKVQITLVRRITDTGELEDVDEEALAVVEKMERNGFRWLFVPWLHAKLYFSESAVLITSLNLLSTSIANSVEVGLYSEAPEDVETARQYYQREIAPMGRTIETRTGPRQSKSAATELSPRSGHCIRCGEGVPFNTKRPYCADDYASWAQYENEDYVDKFCHRCGERHKATMRKPICGNCYATA